LERQVDRSLQEILTRNQEAIRLKAILNDLVLFEGLEVLQERSCSTKQLLIDRLSG